MTDTKIIREWIDLCKAGYNSKKIAKEYNVSPGLVRYHLKNRGVYFNKERPRKELYKGKFVIGMYDLNDELFHMFNNVRHMSKVLEIEEKLLAPRISRNHKFRYKNEWYKLKLIEIGEENDN